MGLVGQQQEDMGGVGGDRFGAHTKHIAVASARKIWLNTTHRVQFGSLATTPPFTSACNQAACYGSHRKPADAGFHSPKQLLPLDVCDLAN